MRIEINIIKYIIVNKFKQWINHNWYHCCTSILKNHDTIFLSLDELLMTQRRMVYYLGIVKTYLGIWNVYENTVPNCARFNLLCPLLTTNIAITPIMIRMPPPPRNMHMSVTDIHTRVAPVHQCLKYYKMCIMHVHAHSLEINTGSNIFHILN